MFEKRISARKFGKAEVNVFEEHVDGEAVERYENQRRAGDEEKQYVA